MTPEERTQWVVVQARTLGFDLCGVAPAQGLPELAYLDEWLARGYAGEMRYLEDPRRGDPQRVLEGAKSIIVCALNYNTPLPYSTQLPTTVAAGFTPANHLADMKSSATNAGDIPRGWISRYAWGDDYHKIVGELLEALRAAIRAQFAEPFDARTYVDTGPIVERVAAKHAGLGWLAKNTCLINEKLGSWLFLVVIITSLELEPSAGAAEGPASDLCGNCRLCIEACPTGAIVEPYVLDARRCISYLTIELRGSIPEELRAPMGRHVFGCDICQDVCPYNRNAPVSSVKAFWPRELEFGTLESNRRDNTRNSILETGDSKNETRYSIPNPEVSGRDETREKAPAEAGVSPAESGSTRLTSDHYSLFTPKLEWLASLSEAEFKQIFQGSAVKRTKWRGLVRNACVALGNALATHHPPLAGADSARIVALLKRLSASDDSVIVEHAKWALSRMHS